MLIYNGLIALYHDPATDILETSMPRGRQLGLPEERMCLGLIVSNVRNHGIKKLLLDAGVPGAGSEAHTAATVRLAAALVGTRLRRIAHVGASSREREEEDDKVYAALRHDPNQTVEYRSFAGRAEAMEWLLSL